MNPIFIIRISHTAVGFGMIPVYAGIFFLGIVNPVIMFDYIL